MNPLFTLCVKSLMKSTSLPQEDPVEVQKNKLNKVLVMLKKSYTFHKIATLIEIGGIQLREEVHEDY